MKNKIYKSVDACIDWIKAQMCSFNKASLGIYERIRIDENQRVCWTRPDCNAEFLLVLDLFKQVTGKDNFDYFQNVSKWLLSKQNGENTGIDQGSFYFFYLDGSILTEEGTVLYQNDNAKVLYSLLSLSDVKKDEKMLLCCKRLADFWANSQSPSGYFYNPNSKTMYVAPKGPCFVGWMLMAMYKAYSIFAQEKYLISGRKALNYLLDEIILDARIRTSYELEKNEAWRPYSSEISILLYALTVAIKFESDNAVIEKAKLKLEFLFNELQSLCHDTGAVINNKNTDSLNGLTLQVGENICDLVYTQGFALRALVEYYRTFNDKKALELAKNLGEFLMSIQCENENPLWDGAWRGSYNVVEGCWAGRCNQNNAIDEGGMYSVYTGWCCTNIMIGLLELEKHLGD